MSERVILKAGPLVPEIIAVSICEVVRTAVMVSSSDCVSGGGLGGS